MGEILVVHLSAWKVETLSSLVLSALELDVLWLITLEFTLELPSIFPGSEPTWKVVMETHLHHQPKDPPKDPLKLLDLVLIIGLVTTSVMTKTTMLLANLMEVIAVETMLTPNTALLANVWKQPLLPPPLLRNQPMVVVKSLNGKEMVGVMMETTMLVAALMVETAVGT